MLILPFLSGETAKLLTALLLQGFDGRALVFKQQVVYAFRLHIEKVPPPRQFDKGNFLLPIVRGPRETRTRSFTLHLFYIINSVCEVYIYTVWGGGPPCWVGDVAEG